MASNPPRCPPSSQADRKVIERNRRKDMKALFSTLNSLVPHQSSREPKTVPDQLEDAANYIKELQNRIEKLKEKKEKLMGEKLVEKDGRRWKHERKTKLLLQVKAHLVGSSMEVFLTTGSDYHFILQQILRLIQDNGADIINVNQTAFTDRVFHKITAQVDGEGMAPEDGERICETVKNFVSQYKGGQCSV